MSVKFILLNCNESETLPIINSLDRNDYEIEMFSSISEMISVYDSSLTGIILFKSTQFNFDELVKSFPHCLFLIQESGGDTFNYPGIPIDKELWEEKHSEIFSQLINNLWMSHQLYVQSTRQRDDILNSLPEGTCLLDLQGRIQVINQILAQRMGRSVNALLGINFYNTMNPETASKFKTMVMKCHQTKECVHFNDVFGGKKWTVYLQPLFNSSGVIDKTCVIYRDITEIHKTEEKLKTMSLVDEETGLCNKRGFLAISEPFIKVANRRKKRIIVFMMKIPNISWIKEVHGAEMGKKSINVVAKSLRKSFRDSDIIARWSDEIFIVFAFDTQNTTSELLLNRFNVNLEAEQYRDPSGLNFALDYGFADYDPDFPETLNELVNNAEAALNEHKHHNR